MKSDISSDVNLFPIIVNFFKKNLSTNKNLTLSLTQAFFHRNDYHPSNEYNDTPPLWKEPRLDRGRRGGGGGEREVFATPPPRQRNNQGWGRYDNDYGNGNQVYTVFFTF